MEIIKFNKVKKNGQKDSSKQSSEDRNAQESGDSSDKSEEGADSSNSQKEGESSSGISEKIYSMQANNMLGKQVAIDWDELKNKIENLFTTWTVVSLDLNTLGVSNDELNNFSKNMDRIAVAIKEENKEETISLIVDLYGFLPVFIKEYNSNSREQNIIDTKYKLLICYKYADLEEWEELYKSVDELKKSFSNIVNKKEDFPKKGVNIKSAEVILNEIYNSVEIKEKEIFFIKYKNFIQELNIILSI